MYVLHWFRSLMIKFVILGAQCLPHPLVTVNKNYLMLICNFVVNLVMYFSIQYIIDSIKTKLSDHSPKQHTFILLHSPFCKKSIYLENNNKQTRCIWIPLLVSFATIVKAAEHVVLFLYRHTSKDCPRRHGLPLFSL